MPHTTPAKTILILGSGGKLGTMLRRIWRNAPPDDISLQYQSRSPLTGLDAHVWSPGDPFVQLPPCDAVIALWGRATGGARELAQNTELADQAYHIAQAKGADRVIHLSSAAVYGPAQDATEDTAPAPAHDYGRSKLAMEAHIAGFDGPARHICLRLANVVGADSLAPALRGTGSVTLDRFPDGLGPVRSYIGARDLADVLRGLTRLPLTALPKTLNVAARRPVAMQDLAEAAGKVIAWRKAPPEAVQCVTLSTDRLSQILPDLTPSSDAKALITAWRDHGGSA